MGLSIKVDVQGALLKGKAPEIVYRNLEVAVTKVTLLLTREVIARTPQGVYGGQGGLISSIGHQIVKGTPVIKGLPVIKGIVVSKSQYVEVVENGRRAGAKMPPGAVLSSGFREMKEGQKVSKGEVAYSRLRDRARVAYHDNADGGLVRWIVVKFGVDIKKAIQLEYVVRRAIAKKGIKGTHMFEKAFNENEGKIAAMFNEAGFDLIKELNE